MTDTIVIAEEGAESTGYKFSWSLAIAGGVAATAVTFFVLSLGSGFGLLLVHPITHSGPSVPAFLTGGAIYFLCAQAFGYAVGGHLVGRLLGPLAESHLQEEFRTAAHGLIAWAVAVLATLTVVALAGLTFASTGAMTAAMYGAGSLKSFDAGPSTYYVDVLVRPDQTNRGRTLARANLDAGAQAEAGRILDAGMIHGEQLAASDRTRLIDLVSDQANVSRDEATSRVDRMQAHVQAMTRHAEDVARKVASYASLWIAFSLLFGAVVSMVAAVAARNEDERESIRGAAR